MTSTPEVDFQREYFPVFEDLKEAQRSHRGEKGGKWNRPWFGWILLVGCAVGLFVMLQKRNMLSASPRESLLAMIPWLLPIAALFYLWRYVLRLEKKAWDENEKAHCAQTLKVTVDGITIENQFGANVYRWPAFLKFTESANLFILYTSPNCMVVVPKRAFKDPEEIDWFRPLLQKEITERRAAATVPGFPVLLPSDTQVESNSVENMN